MPNKSNAKNKSNKQGATQNFTEQAESTQRQASNQNSKTGTAPPISPTSLKLTEYTEDGKLVFSPNETWELTPGQNDFREAFEKFDAMILRGPAGSGKTDITAREVLGMLRDGKTDRILLSAPVDEGGEEIGFRPGNDHEKMHDHVSQFLKAFDGHLGNGDFRAGKKIRENLIEQGVIDLQPMGTLSGENLRRTVLIVDEAHKARMQHLLIALTRLHHEGSKVIFTGDEKQHMNTGVSAFREFAKRFSDNAYKDYIATINYSADDIKRHPMTKLIAERDDDIPPGLAARMKEEEFTPDKIKSMLTKHFEKVSSGRKDPMAEQVVRTYLSRQPEHVLLDLLQQSQSSNTPEPGA